VTGNRSGAGHRLSGFTAHKLAAQFSIKKTQPQQYQRICPAQRIASIDPSRNQGPGALRARRIQIEPAKQAKAHISL
jgi:hypothetical protein